MKAFRLRWILLLVTAVWVIAPVSHSQPGADASGMERPASAADLFLGRLQKLFAADSETPIRTWTFGRTVFFESSDWPTGVGNLEFSGHVILDSTGQTFDGVLERFSISGGLIRLELKQAARIRCAPDGIVAVEGFVVDGPQGRISAAGSLAPDGEFEMVFQLAGVDPRAFIPLLAPAPVGTLDAELRLRGDWENASGVSDAMTDIALSAGRLRTEAGIPPLESLHLTARINRHRLDIGSLDGLLGGAPFQVTGRIEEPLTLSENGFVDLSITGDNLLLYRSEAIRVRAATDLRVAGAFSRLGVNGTLSITEGRYEKSFGLLEGLRGAAQKGPASRLELFSIRSQPFRTAEFDVAVNATKAFEIKNNRVHAAARPELRWTGSGETPILTGRISLDSAILYLPAGRMQFERGVVRFEPPDPGRPLLELNGRGRFQGYDVRAVVEGPYDQPTMTLAASPALANEELLLLVLSGQTPSTRRGLDSERSRDLDVAVLLGKEMMTRIEGSRSNDTLQSVMDRFDVDVGHSPTRSGDEAVRVLFRVADGIFREGDTLYLVGEKDTYGYVIGGLRIAFRFR